MNYISDLSQEKAMSAIKQGHTDLMALKDAIKSARKSCKSTRAAKGAYSKAMGAEMAGCADVHLQAADEALKLALKHVKSAHGVVQERREAMTASDIDPIPDIPFT